MNKYFMPALVALLAISVTGASASWAYGYDIDEKSCQTVTEIAVNNYPILYQALVAAGLDDAFNKTDLFVTVFAPSDNAFTTAFAKKNVTGEAVLADKNLTAEILKAHVVPGLVMLDSFQFNTLAENERLSIQPLAVLGWNGNAQAKVFTPPTKACRSMIYSIDSVMLPDKANKALG